MPITCEFYKYCEIIRKFGFKLKKSVNSFTDNSAVKRIYLLNVSEKKLCLYLEETYTSLEISFSYKDTHESRNLRGNIISNKFTKSSKTTEDYRTVTNQVEPSENVNLIKEILEKINKDVLFKYNIVEIFYQFFENTLGKYNSINSTNKLFSEQIGKLNQQKIKIELEYHWNEDFYGNKIKLDEIFEIIVNSDKFKNLNKYLKEEINYELCIEMKKESNELYLSSRKT